VPGEGANQNEEQAEAMKIARKVTRMMIAVVFLYILCWFPLYVSVILIFSDLAQIKRTWLSLFINFPALSYSGINPYIYIGFSQNFRASFKKIFSKCLGRSFGTVNVILFRSQSVELEQI